MTFETEYQCPHCHTKDCLIKSFTVHFACGSSLDMSPLLDRFVFDKSPACDIIKALKNEIVRRFAESQ